MSINNFNIEVSTDIKEQKSISIPTDSILGALKSFKQLQNINLNNTIILLSNSEGIYELNVIGSIIWENLKKNKTLDDIAKMLFNTFKIDTQTLYTDIIRFIQELEQKKFLLLKNKNA